MLTHTILFSGPVTALPAECLLGAGEAAPGGSVVCVPAGPRPAPIWCPTHHTPAGQSHSAAAAVGPGRAVIRVKARG